MEPAWGTAIRCSKWLHFAVQRKFYSNSMGPVSGRTEMASLGRMPC
jgi:hypothetical protein